MRLQQLVAAVVVLCSLARAADPAPATLDYRKEKDGYLLVLKPGQKVIESLKALTEKEHLPGAHFTAIGAVKNAEVAYYNLETKAYQPKKFETPAEVISLTGSLGYFEDKPIVHAHLAMGGPDYQIYGGHLVEAEVSIVLEIFVTPTQEKIVRELTTEFPGVRVMNLKAK